jgi:hypothetical protein
MSPTPAQPGAATTAKDIEALPDQRAAFDGEEPNVTPEEQHQYDTVVYKAMEMLYSDDNIPIIMEKLKGGAKNISAEIGHSAAMVLTSIEQTVAQNDQQIPEDNLFNAGQEIVSQIVDIAVAAKVVSEEQSQDVAEAAFYEGLRIYGQNMGRDGKLGEDKSAEARDLMRQAGIEQDPTKIPGKQPAAGGEPQQGQPPGPPGPPQAQPATPPVGIINQAAGVPK